MIRDRTRDFLSRLTISAPIRNKMMKEWSSEENFLHQRFDKEEARKKEGRLHEIFYFHKIDDPYSHLTIQIIDKLEQNYNVVLTPFLVGDTGGDSIPEPSMYLKHCLKDAIEIAPHYGLKFNSRDYPPTEKFIQANQYLSGFVNTPIFLERAKKVSFLLWNNEDQDFDNNEFVNLLPADQTSNVLSVGNQKLSECGYYFGSSFHYEGENYWGIDRLDHLEERLTELGTKKNNVSDFILKRIEIVSTPASSGIEKEKFNLEFFPSLNSPYTYISFKRVREIANKYPVNLKVKPVLPMIMRGMKIHRNKGKYVLSDAAREGRKYGTKIKDIYSPIGAPARKAYSLFEIIDKNNKGFDFLEELTKASFFDGINIGDEKFLDKLITKLDLSWRKVKAELNNDRWEAQLDENLKNMYAGNCWGVPTLKLTNKDGSNPYYKWGQDRLWLIENEIVKRMN